jgi:hypothetical protein
MKFYDIDESAVIVPGEFLLYVPRNTVVVCGAYDGTTIRALINGRLLEDDVDKFKKITITEREKKRRYVSTCKGCSG